MKRCLNSSGMETTMTMAMLIIAVSLIISASSYIFNNENEKDGVDLRSMQASHIGVCILKMKEERDPLEGPVLEEGSHSIFIWNDDNLSRKGSNSTIDPIILETLSWTPDMMWCIIILEKDDAYISPDRGIYIIWNWEFSDGTTLTVVLPRNREPLPTLEGYDC